jgi:hypothetical protein
MSLTCPIKGIYSEEVPPRLCSMMPCKVTPCRLPCDGTDCPLPDDNESLAEWLKRLTKCSDPL